MHRVTIAADVGTHGEPEHRRAADREQRDLRHVGGAVRRDHAEGRRVEQTNFHDYRCARMNESPKIDMHLSPTAEKPGWHRRAGHGADRAAMATRCSRHRPAAAQAAVQACLGSRSVSRETRFGGLSCDLCWLAPSSALPDVAARAGLRTRSALGDGNPGDAGRRRSGAPRAEERPPFPRSVHCPPPSARARSIIAHGRGWGPDFELYGMLRMKLAEAGYSTLSIQMPVLPGTAKIGDYMPIYGDADERFALAADWLRARGNKKRRDRLAQPGCDDGEPVPRSPQRPDSRRLGLHRHHQRPGRHVPHPDPGARRLRFARLERDASSVPTSGASRSCASRAPGRWSSTARCISSRTARTY